MKLRSLIFTAAAFVSTAGMAEQVPGTQLDVFAESANIGGTGRSVFVRQLPVQNRINGELNFYDVTFQLSIKNGDVVFDKVSQVEVTKAPILSTEFRAGRYEDVHGNVYALRGPSVTAKGYEEYSLVLLESNSTLTDFSGGFGTTPSSEQFGGPTTPYTTHAEVYDALEDAGEVMGKAEIRGTDGVWGTNGKFDYISAKATDSSSIRFYVWDNAFTEGTVVLTYAGGLD